MTDEQRLSQKFYWMKRTAAKRDEQWKITAVDFIKWGMGEDILAPTSKTVRRIDPNKAWTIHNLKIVEAKRVYRSTSRTKVTYNRLSVDVEVTPTTTLTKAQWVAELRAANGA
ncbi:hypothetical protein FY140_03470 [Agrobacterium tumefaciens]|uniref:hypothetical protein n=1 Tax=Agrobacterium tumefaciens TaxID=358 RepID=UPI00160F082F|nr:hypothetical protein [Agrobacterium tumefaciens]MBB2905797.1 hypothetical protein [Rhizobium sp. RAS22]UXT19841.1 hypothetical protein FY140_03470 [Agrobacterium tumefaciens]